MRYIPLFFFCLITGASALAQGARYYVRAQAQGDNTGLSWADAFTDLQQALHLAQAGDEVWVAEGSYRPTATNDRTVAFEPHSGVQVYGGFAGTEADPAQRDWAAHPAILSGDIGTAGDSTDNSYNVMYLFEPDSNTILDGLTFRDGVADNTLAANGARDRKICGGALYIMAEGAEAYPDIRNCRFEHNTAYGYGGAVMVNGGSDGSVAPRFQNCTFERNRCVRNGGGLTRFGGSWVDRGAFLDSCAFTLNQAGQRGAGLFFSASFGIDSLTIRDCSFTQNVANIAGGGAFFFLGRPGKSYFGVIGTNFISNVSGEGAALDVFSNGNIFNGLIVVENSLFNKNKTISNNSNGLIASSSFAPISLDMENNTFFNNNPRRFVICDSLKISNTVFQDSTETNSFIGRHTSSISNCSFRSFNCLAQIQPITCGPDILTGIDPLFVNPDSGDFRLQPCSPLINAGSNAYLDPEDTTDLGGRPRVRGGTVDIGAYEAQGPSLAATPQASPSCPGGASGALELAVQDACPPLGFAWQSGTASGATLSGLPAGDYQFTLTDAKGQQLVFSAAVPQGSGPTLVGATTPVVCGDTLGGSAAAGLNAGALPFSYTWAGSASTDSLRSGLAAGSYAVTVTDARGCSAARTVTVDKTGNLGVDIDVADISCPGAADGGLTVLPANGKAPFTWHWSGGANTPTLAPLGPGTYLGALTDALNCTIGWILPLGEPEALQANPLVGNASDSMALNGRIELQPSGGTAPYAALWSTGAAGLSIDSLAAGWYTLTLTDAHDCTLVETVAVGVASATGAPGSEAPGFTLTPNPAAAAVWLLLTQPAATDWPVRLYNTSGQLVREIRLPAGAERFRLTTADWPRGVYFVQVAGRMEKLVLE